MLEKGLYWPAVTIGVGVLPPSPLWALHWWRLQSHVHGPCKWRVSSHPYSNGRVSTIWKQIRMWYSNCLWWSCQFVMQLTKLPWSWWMDTSLSLYIIVWTFVDFDILNDYFIKLVLWICFSWRLCFCDHPLHKKPIDGPSHIVICYFRDLCAIAH